MKRSLIPLNALRVFDAAARSLSFTRAAEELAVTPAAVGQQIRALEETLGVILFRRTAKGLELTPEAAAALAPLRAGFQGFEETIAALLAGQAGTRLHLAVARGAIAHWLMPRLLAWLRENPDVRLQITALDAPVDFREANFDLALSFGPAPDAEGVFGRKLADEQLAMVARPGAPDRLIAVGSSDEATLSVADPGTALDLAIAGLGTAQVPITLARGPIGEGLLEERGERVPTENGFWLCAPAPQWKSAKVKALVAVLLADAA